MCTERKDWNVDKLDRVMNICARIATKKYFSVEKLPVLIRMQKFSSPCKHRTSVRPHLNRYLNKNRKKLNWIFVFFGKDSHFPNLIKPDFSRISVSLSELFIFLIKKFLFLIPSSCECWFDGGRDFLCDFANDKLDWDCRGFAFVARPKSGWENR